MTDRDRTKRQSEFISTCGNCKTGWSCCHETRPPIIKRRREIIEAYLKKKGFAIDRAFVDEEYTFPAEQRDGYCVFRDSKSGKCMVHEVKPETCVAGPVTFDINLRTGKIEWFLKFESLCQLAGALSRDNDSLQKHVRSAKRELLKLVDGLASTELKAILKKDEPETFKFAEDSLDKSVLSKLL